MCGARRARMRLRQALLIKPVKVFHQLIKALALMALHLARTAARFVGHFQTMLRRQLFDALDKFQSIVIHQKVDSVAVRATA